MEAPLGKPEGVFHDSIPGENGVGLRFRSEFFNIFNHPNFCSPNNTLNSPLFGCSTQTLASSQGSFGTPVIHMRSSLRSSTGGEGTRMASTFYSSRSPVDFRECGLNRVSVFPAESRGSTHEKDEVARMRVLQTNPLLRSALPGLTCFFKFAH
jgi:hypothetical protein